MTYTRVIKNGRVHSCNPINLSNVDRGIAGEIYGEADSYRCPQCDKNVFFICPDKDGDVLACYNLDCMEIDARISKGRAQNKIKG